MKHKLASVTKYGWIMMVITLFGVAAYLLGFRQIIAITPLYLVANFYLFSKDSQLIGRDYGVLAAAACIGFAAEVIGVNTGLLFGDYSYGSVLSISLFGVPLIIGLLWAMLCGSIWSFLPTIYGAKRVPILMVVTVLYDLVLERFATTFGLWNWAFGIPISNYVGWAIVSGCIGVLFQLKILDIKRSSTALLLIPAHTFFFVVLLAL
jgi:bisanhydrobacterioruberin hydratase